MEECEQHFVDEAGVRELGNVEPAASEEEEGGREGGKEKM